MTDYMYIATLAWALLCLAYLLRRRRWLHVPLAVSGMLLDILLVAFLQLTRNAVQTAVSFNLSLMEQIHIANSSIALLLYVPVFYFGVKLAVGGATPSQRAWHLKLAIAALVFRSLGFVFMASLIK